MSLVTTICQAYCGLGAQDLQEAKDQLLVETSDMLRIPLFTAEALLRNHGTCATLVQLSTTKSEDCAIISVCLCAG